MITNQFNDQEVNFLLCYENLKNENSVLFEECGHTLCRGCINEIIFTKFPKCPIVMKVVLNIHDGMTITKSLTVYQYYLLLSNEYSSWNSVKNYLLETTEKSWSIINETIKKVFIALRAFEK